MSEDGCEGSGGTSGQDRANASRPPAAKELKKDRLAAALRENLKRRKAQISARRQETAPKETAPK